MTATIPRLDAVEAADIRGKMTSIRPMRPDEAPTIYEWTKDPDVFPFWGGRDHHKDLDDFLRHWEPHYFDGSQPRLGRCFAIDADDRLIGVIAYNRVDLDARSTEIDVLIGDPGYRGRAYGTDAVRAFLGFLFDTVGLHRVWLATYDYNARAQRAYEKAGFSREGLLRESDWVDGRWVDSVVYGILEHEFRRR